MELLIDQTSPNQQNKDEIKNISSDNLFILYYLFYCLVTHSTLPVCPPPAQVSTGAGAGGGVSAPPGGDLPAPAAGAPEQRSPEGCPVLATVQQQQPQLRLGPALQLFHALLPIDAQPRGLEQEHGQYRLLLGLLVHHYCSVRCRRVL